MENATQQLYYGPFTGDDKYTLPKYAIGQWVKTDSRFFGDNEKGETLTIISIVRIHSSNGYWYEYRLQPNRDHQNDYVLWYREDQLSEALKNDPKNYYLFNLACEIKKIFRGDSLSSLAESTDKAIAYKLNTVLSREFGTLCTIYGKPGQQHIEQQVSDSPGEVHA